jgi:hypothetical protein
MHREMQATHAAGSKWVFGILFFLIPSLLAFAWVSALSRNASPASALWFLYEVSRLFACIGIVIATGFTLGIAIRGSASGLFVALMILSIGSAALLVWYTVHIFKSPW